MLCTLNAGEGTRTKGICGRSGVPFRAHFDNPLNAIDNSVALHRSYRSQVSLLRHSPSLHRLICCHSFILAYLHNGCPLSRSQALFDGHVQGRWPRAFLQHACLRRRRRAYGGSRPSRHQGQLNFILFCFGSISFTHFKLKDADVLIPKDPRWNRFQIATERFPSTILASRSTWKRSAD